MDFPCYTVSEDNAPPNVLFEYNPSIQSWTEIGETGGTNIEAIATDPITDIIYATDNGTFGIINVNTALFTPIGDVGSGNGDAGLIELNDVDGLTYDPVNQIMYGTHRVGGLGPGTNDVLFQIDVATGQLIPGAMLGANNKLADYVIIQEVFEGTFGIEVYDVDDIAYNPYDGKLYAIQNQDGPGTITEIDPVTGEIIEIVYDTWKDDTEGLGFDYLGELYATGGEDGTSWIGKKNMLTHLNIEEGITTELHFIDTTHVENDFEAFDCFTAYNDLALKIEVDPDTQQHVKVGETVTYQITIYNQGDFRNSDITVTNYMPEGFGLADTNWTNLANGKVTYTISETLEPNTSITIALTFIVSQGIEGQTITASAEISSSFSPDIIDVQGNRFTDPLPDLDSQPDDINNEVNISDNEINAGGPNANQDEDDHDIAIVEVQELIVNPPDNNPTYFPCYTVAENDDLPNVLFKFNPTTGSWIEVGIAGGSSIEAIATDPNTGVIYATDEGTFGTIDANTALFTPIGEIGSGNGDMGNIDLNDVDGLTYDPVNQILYGTHRIEGREPGTNDLLFQIDISTGQVVSNAMLDANNNSADYAVIPEVFENTYGDVVYDVDDIAYNPYEGKLYAIHNRFNYGVITEINPVSGEILFITFDLSEDNVEGIGFSYLGDLYATIGDEGDQCVCYQDDFFYINLSDATSEYIGPIDSTGYEIDFEAFDCFTAYNDLALKMELDPNTQQPIKVGETVTYQITIYNQGDFRNSNITLTNYIPDGLDLVDPQWTIISNGKASYTLNETLEAGATTTANISFKVREGYEGKTLTNTAEISSSFSPDIIDVQGNRFTDPLPDLDSQPDDYNGNEKNVSDNEINGGGPNANEDEDDHDIAMVEVEGPDVNPPNINPPNFPCYAVSEDNAAPNVLFEYNPSTEVWTEVGITGGTHIEAIATDPVTGIIYATDDGTFGTIDAQTALFNPIGEIGLGIGDKDLVNLDDVDGLTYDPINKIMYATHNVAGYGPGTNGLLFQIDIATGKVIPGAMLDANNNPVDYAIIPEIFDGEFGGNLYDVDDIAYNAYTDQLYAIQTQDGPAYINQLDPLNGQILEVIYGPPYDDIEGLGFNSLGELFGTTGNNGSTFTSRNALINFDLVWAETTPLNSIDPTNQYVDFEAFDCSTAYNDLALLVETESNELVKIDSTVTFLLTIFNQGNFPNTNITITNYIPEGLILEDDNWIDIGDGKASYTFEGVLEPSENHTITITYTVEPGFDGQILTNTAEISSSYLADINDVLSFNYPTDFNGNPTPLPDLDSQPDNENNETNIVDNEILGGGPNSIDNKDEDDHDIAVIEVQEIPCPAYLIIPDEEISGHFKAQQEIEIRGCVNKTKTALFDICK